MRLLTNLLLLFSFAGFVQAQEPPSLVKILVSHWETSKALTLAVADAMPEADYSFKATPSEMSFGEQMNHIAKGNTNYCSVATGSANPLASATQDNSKAGAKTALTTAFDFCIAGLQKMSDADLMKMVGKSGPHQTTAFERFWGGFTHAAHHRGQAEVYLRLKGIKPPEYQF